MASVYTTTHFHFPRVAAMSLAMVILGRNNTELMKKFILFITILFAGFIISCNKQERL